LIDGGKIWIYKNDRKEIDIPCTATHDMIVIVETINILNIPRMLCERDSYNFFSFNINKVIQTDK